MTPPAVVPILMYHQVAGPGETAGRLAVPSAAFAAQLHYLHEQGFTTLTAGAAARALAAGGRELPARPVALTFDDGYADFHTQVLPALQRYGFTATLFVTTGWIEDAGQHAAGRRPGRMLTWSQLAEAAAAGIEIGAHSHRHPQLDQLPHRLLRPELDDCRDLLEDRLRHPVPGLAYPFGYSSATVRAAVRQAGHHYACAVGNVIAGPGADPFALPRLTVRRSTTEAEFADIASGRRLAAIFSRDRALTKGYAVLRRCRSAARAAAGFR